MPTHRDLPQEPSVATPLNLSPLLCGTSLIATSLDEVITPETFLTFGFQTLLEPPI